VTVFPVNGYEENDMGMYLLNYNFRKSTGDLDYLNLSLPFVEEAILNTSRTLFVS
jgi:hypothetical protein